MQNYGGDSRIARNSMRANLDGQFVNCPYTVATSTIKQILTNNGGVKTPPIANIKLSKYFFFDLGTDIMIYCHMVFLNFIGFGCGYTN